jgi:type IV pilus assembly protein PilY1
MRYLLAILVLVAVGSAAVASVDSACWNRNLERMDYYTDPPQGGDQSFFSTQAQSGVIVLIYPTKSSLLDFPLSLYEIRHDLGGSQPTGCTNSYLNSLKYALPYQGTSHTALAGSYSPGSTYPDPEPTYASGDQPVSDGLTTGSYYRYRNWTPEGAGTAETSFNACKNAGGFASLAACQACLATTGYWLNPNATNKDVTSSAAVFSTNWLRFYPPKWSILKLAYKRMVAGPLLGTLREGVMVAGGGISGNGTDGVGGYVIQKLLPQSCSGQGAANGAGILKQKLQAVEGASYTSKAYPLAEMMFNDGYYQSGTDGSWCCSATSNPPYFSNSFVLNSNLGSTGKGGPCPGCQQDFFVIFSDGRGDTANPFCTPDSNGDLPGPCQAASQCNSLGMGPEADGDNFLDPNQAGGAGPLLTGAGVRQTAPGTCDMDFSDDVAGWMANNNMLQSSPGSTVLSYVVAVGSNRYGALNSLQAVAQNGKGGFLSATDFQSFEAALTQTLQQIIQRTTSFSVAAITTVQTRGNTYAFIPRFTPAQGNVWDGKLNRFALLNEFAAGCTSADYTKTDANNPNGNSSCADVYLKDANGNFVGDDSQGNIVKLDTSQPYPWPPLPPLAPVPPGTPQLATPFWEASQVLTSRVNAVNAGTSTDTRTVYTAVDTNADGVPDSLISFDASALDLTTLTPLLALGGYQSDFCFEMAAKTGHTYTQESQCAADLIDYVRGQDVFRQNPLNRTTPPPASLYARPNILGDIFHSSPILETPPAGSFLCDLGVITQCAHALYSDTLTPNGSAAYTLYQTTNQYRTQVLLVGANDGMLHAFNAGNDQLGDDPATPTIEGPTNHYFDTGTGREMWAFVPPDLLPKLRLYAIGTRHEMFVDGTPMVKDVWVDGSGATGVNRMKDADEFHTIAITGERDGGRSYFALDVTSPTAPKYLWEWPPVGSKEGLNAGRSWDDFAPSPPPVGPVAVNDVNGPLKINGVKASERYVVALGGGFDENLLVGAGFYILDAWTGQQVFRAARVDATSSSDPRGSMFPVAATPGLLDKDGDGLFDTLLVGDVGGQLWVAGLQVPGLDANGDGIFDNWFAARAFIEFKGQALYKRSPFFQEASAAILPAGDIRVYLGSGNRDQIKDPNGTDCQLSDILGCVRDDCAVDVKQVSYQSGTQYVDAEWKYSSGATTLAVDTYSTSSGSASNACSDVATVDVETTITCGGTAQPVISNTISCNWGTPECSGNGKPDSTLISYTPSITQQNARFYSIHLFDSGNRQPFTTAAAAALYDSYALTDSDLVNADVTMATDSGNGYYIQYQSLPEKTASQSLVLAGCVIVNTLKASQPPASYCGGNLPSDTAYTYQADAITGAIACGIATAVGSSTATATARFTSSSAIVPPPMPTPVVSLNQATSTVSYSGVSLAPGAGPTQIEIGGGDIIGPVEWLEVSRKTHNCRHAGGSCN